MRYLKFRGWHSISKKMFSAEEMGADQLTLSVDGRGFVNVNGDSVTRSVFYPTDKFIPMQFTGVLDNNGVEIYEGDLVNVSLHVAGRCSIGIKKVMFYSGSFGLYDADNTGDFISLWGGYEVVGNIHENPELLK